MVVFVSWLRLSLKHAMPHAHLLLLCIRRSRVEIRARISRWVVWLLPFGLSCLRNKRLPTGVYFRPPLVFLPVAMPEVCMRAYVFSLKELASYPLASFRERFIQSSRFSSCIVLLPASQPRPSALTQMSFEANFVHPMRFGFRLE